MGWIGRNRLEAVMKAGVAEVVAVADSSHELARDAAQMAPGASVTDSLEALLKFGLDGIVIATPSALHADQAVTAIERGAAVFCQKPIGRDAAETRRVIEAARAADVLLSTDFSYRYVKAVREVNNLCRSGELGDIFCVELVFHNAYGPDKPWFYDWKLSGGGCVIDLGIHLVDLTLWNLGFPRVDGVTSRLFARGRPIRGRCDDVEDFALARLDLETGATIHMTCSWRLPAGCDAIISGSFYGTRGGAGFRNVNGSFYDFVAERFRGTKSQTLATPPDSWGGRAILDWAHRLAAGQSFDREIETAAQVAETLDAVYAHSGGRTSLAR
jgi:predicted dehydrogenase